MSAPMCDAFLVLAQADQGLTCFFMPRFAPDGSVNAIQFQRLKDKLGNRSNASSEVEFVGAYAEAVGDEGKGIRTIIQMVQMTRQDCAIASVGLMRSGLAHALHHTRHRSVFQKHLADQPLMQAVLSDMALHVEASTAVVMRLCRAFDRTPLDPAEAAYMRLLTPAIKYWTCKSAPPFLYEAMECLGGNGYVEDGILARHYRESPVNAIWEGSGNVMCLDVLRALARAGGSGIGPASACCRDQRSARGRRDCGIHRQDLRPPGRRARSAPCGREAGAACGRRRAQRRVTASSRTVRCHAPRHEPRQHVRRGRARERRRAHAAGAGAAVSLPNESLLMDSSIPICRRSPRRRRRLVWKFWGTALWGIAIFAAMFVGQIGAIVYLVWVARDPIDLASMQHIGREPASLAFSVTMGLPATLAAVWLAIRIKKASFVDYLAFYWPSWKQLLFGAVGLILIVVAWETMSRVWAARRRRAS